MNKEKLQEAKYLEKEIEVINVELNQWRNKDNGSLDLLNAGFALVDDEKGMEAVRETVIKVLTNRRRSLQRKFNKL